MFIDEFTSTTDHQLTQVLSTLKHIHGIEINFNKTTDRQLLKLQESTRRARDVIIENSEFNSWLTNPEYTKNVLILEAVRLYLAEIAPKRRPKTSKMYEDQQEPEANANVAAGSGTMSTTTSGPVSTVTDPNNTVPVIGQNNTTPIGERSKNPMRKTNEAAKIRTLNVLGKRLQSLLENRNYRKTASSQSLNNVANNLVNLGKPYYPRDIKGLTESWRQQARSMDKVTAARFLSLNEKALRLALNILREAEEEGFDMGAMGAPNGDMSMGDDGEASENLEHAQTLLAAQDMSDRLQKMAEQVAKMAVEDLMPLVDIMKRQFGQEQADGFNTVVKAALDDLLNKTTEVKDQTDNAVLSMQKGEVPTASGGSLETDHLPGAGPESGDLDGDMPPPEEDDGFGATEPAAGPKRSPLGRDKKPPIQEKRGATSRSIARRR